MIKSKRFCAILGAATFAASLSLPVLAGSAKDDALEACRLQPGCSEAEIIATCKGNTKCIIQKINKRIQVIKETPDRANKAIKKTKDAAIKTRDGINQTAEKTNKKIKNIFKKKHHHHH
jgi:hypothetical protein